MPGAGADSSKVRNLHTGSHHSFYLTQAIEAARQRPELFPTPKGSPEHYGQPRPNDWGDLQAARMPTLTANRRSGLQSHGVNVITGQLNPTFVEWLMGFPKDWSVT